MLSVKSEPTWTCDENAVSPCSCSDQNSPTSSSISGDGDIENVGSPVVPLGRRKLKRRRKRMLTGVSRQRRAANERERRRIQGVNRAFIELKNALPVADSVDISKIDILRVATKWIDHLSKLLDQDKRIHSEPKYTEEPKLYEILGEDFSIDDHELEHDYFLQLQGQGRFHCVCLFFSILISAVQWPNLCPPSFVKKNVWRDVFKLLKTTDKGRICWERSFNVRHLNLFFFSGCVKNVAEQENQSRCLIRQQRRNLAFHSLFNKARSITSKLTSQARIPIFPALTLGLLGKLLLSSSISTIAFFALYSHRWFPAVTFSHFRSKKKPEIFLHMFALRESSCQNLTHL